MMYPNIFLTTLLKRLVGGNGNLVTLIYRVSKKYYFWFPRLFGVTTATCVCKGVLEIF